MENLENILSIYILMDHTDGLKVIGTKRMGSLIGCHGLKCQEENDEKNIS